MICVNRFVDILENDLFKISDKLFFRFDGILRSEKTAERNGDEWCSTL
jgi:hypothetical protein